MGSILNFVFSCNNIDELEKENKFNGSNVNLDKNYFQRSALLGHILHNKYNISFDKKILSDSINFYLLECQSSLRDLFGVGDPYDYDFRKSIFGTFDNDFLEKIRRKEITILISSISEPTSHLQNFKKQFESFLKNINLSADCFIFLDSNKEITNLNSFFNKKIFYYNAHFIFDGADSFVNIVNDKNYINELNYKSEILTSNEIEKIDERPYYFLSLNRSNWKIHRTILGCYFNEIDNKKILWSYLSNPSQKYLNGFDNFDYYDEWTEFQKKVVEDNIKKLEIKIPIEIDTKLTKNINGFRTTDTFSKLLTTSSYFQIVTESAFLNNEIFFSEKIIKPIIMMQPFIIISSHRILEHFKDLGFKTFDGIFDEKYDLIENNFERLQFIINEIDRILKLPQEEVKKLYKIYFDICIYNRNHLLENFSKKDSYSSLLSEMSKNIKKIVI